ncbi:MAG: glycosyltransferase family 39 protein [Verrucomicrobiaceae bacterium]|nr:glycosyltransferase family 39 protein [Verrucomicrobiaceae bacterium]
MRLPAALALIVLLWAAVYLPGLGTGEVRGEEARRVLPGRTMIQTGDWIVPRSAGKIYNRKPPGINWATAAAIKITGRMDEWTVRMPSVLGVLALALVIGTAMRGFLGADGALLGALIMLTNIGFIEKGRLAEIEALYCACFGIAIVSWLALWWSGRTRAAWCLSLAVLGLGFLVKGPPHVWFFYAIVIAVLREEKRTRELLRRPHLAGLVIFFGTWAWWALLNSGHNPQKDSGAVWMEQITHRLGFAEFDFTNWLLQIPQSIVNFLPWALLLPLVWRIPLVSDRCPVPHHDDARRSTLLAGLKKGLLAAFLVIALLPSSRPRFMLPLNAVAAILVAAAVQGCAADWRRRLRPWVIGTMAASVVGIGAYAMLLARGVVGGGALRAFAREIEHHTGAPPQIILFRTPERMWPFYLGLGCREIADLDDLPPRARWVMTPGKDREKNVSMLEHRYGSPKGQTVLKEPLTDDAGGKGWEYVLLEFPQ